ncbi:hypothetical protein ABT257_38485, partial [Streptomyces sp. NPDC001250]
EQPPAYVVAEGGLGPAAELLTLIRAAGIQVRVAAQAANQSRVMALAPERSGSLSSVYLVLYFTIGALGTALAAPLLDTLGRQGTALAALLLAATLGNRTRSRANR